MNVLLTGAHGRVGTAIAEHLADEYELTYLDKATHPTRETVIADMSDYDAIRPVFDGQDAVIHLAGDPDADAEWTDLLPNNIVGLRNALEAATDAGASTFVFPSSHHVVGMYEMDHRPAIYDRDFELTIDHQAPVRPDSDYGVTKAYGEDHGRYYAENHGLNFYALRLGKARPPAYDHPYGDAEYAVETGQVKPNSPEYDRLVAKMKALWLSRRDLGQLIHACLQHSSRVPSDRKVFEILYGVSDNERCWFDLEHTRDVVGYTPQDTAEEWKSPPK